MAKVIKSKTGEFALVDLSIWDNLTPDEVLKANTFLAARPENLFSSIIDVWQPFFDMPGISLPSCEVRCFYGLLTTIEGAPKSVAGGTSLQLKSLSEKLDSRVAKEHQTNPNEHVFIGELSCLYGFSIGDDEGFVLLEQSEVSAFIQMFLGALGTGSNVLEAPSKDGRFVHSGYSFVEYILHRFLWSLSRSWRGEYPVSYVFNGSVKSDALADFRGEVVVLSMKFPVMSTRLVIVPPANLLPDFFMSSRSNLPYTSFSPDDPDPNQKVRFTAAFSRLSVDPSLLVDFLRPGAIIDLSDSMRIDEALIFIDQVEQGRAKVMSADGNFLFHFINDTPSEINQRTAASGHTNIMLALVDEVVSVSTLLSSTRYLSCGTKIAARVSLLIGGEVVAKAELGEFGGRSAIRILAREEF